MRRSPWRRHLATLAFGVLLGLGSARAEGPAEPAEAAPASEASPPQLGQAGRLVVRLRADGKALTSPVRAQFAPPSGEAVEFDLVDDGSLPDQQAGDGVFSGAGIVSGASATLTLRAGEWTGSLADVALPSGPPRELDIAMAGDRLVASPAPASGERGFRPSGGSGKGSGSKGRLGGTTPEPASNDVWLLAAGVGGVALLVVGYFWFRRPRKVVVLPEGVSRVVDAGLFGGDTPPLAEGVVQYVAPAEAHPALAARLLGQVATLRPVLVHAAADLAMPASTGNPVYRTALPRPAELHDAAYELQEFHPQLVLVILGAPSPVADWVRDVRDDFPVILVVAEPLAGTGPVVRCTLDGADWRFETAAASA